jgi:3-isopropylmalate/(R)-2-methylmalate dehydratase small subunit
VIAASFARIFYRNAVNIGLPILEAGESVQAIESGDEVEVDLATGEIRNLTHPAAYQAAAFPSFMQQIIKAGGLINYVRERMAD